MNYLFALQETHPYIFSFIVSSLVLITMLFFIFETDLIENLAPTNTIEIIDIDEIMAPKRQTQKEISETATEIDTEQTDRAKGKTGAETFDLAFYPNIAAPRLLSRIPKEHPKSGKDQQLSATVSAELIITEKGKVREVKIIRVILSKKLPKELATSIQKDYASLVKKRLKKARYTPPVKEGKFVEVKMPTTIIFELE